MLRFRPIATLAGAALGLAVLIAAAPRALPLVPPDVLTVAPFSEATPGQPLPDDYETLQLNSNAAPTQYAVVRDSSGTPVVRAESRNAASGVIKRQRIDLDDYPVMTWRWRADNVLESGDARRKRGDDYPARLYVIFDYDPSELGFFDRMKYRALRAMGYDDVPTRALNYLWANRAPVGQIVESPYTDWVMMIPVESGCAHCGMWRTARRDVRADYRAAFGEAPPAVTGVAIMTDTDDTGEAATAYYGDIRFLSAAE